MNCSNCQNPIQPGEKFCGKCGSSININQPDSSISSKTPVVEIKKNVFSRNINIPTVISSNISIFWMIGSVLFYYYLTHRVSGSFGGIALFLIGWSLPIIFMVALSFLLSKWILKIINVKRKVIIFGIILFLVFSSTLVDKLIYELHTLNSDEGCMCMYFSGSDLTRAKDRDTKKTSEISNTKFFQYATESFISDFNPIF